MALHRLLEMEIGVPDPARLDDFYREIGFTGARGSWGAADQPGQIKVVEAPYRQLRSVRLGCEDEADLAATAARLDGLGVKYQSGGGRLKVTDPINAWDFVVEPAAPFDVSPQPVRAMNRPGERNRLGARAEVITEATPRPPRRLGHLVVGTPKPVETIRFFTEGIGYRVSDTIGGGIAAFLRCSPDHHNMLVAPGAVPYLNHYALEHDDFDAVMRAATLYLRAHGDEANLAGPGRHQIGGNIFWYMLDPSGNIFEYFADMDRIVDDEAWVPRDDWDPSDSWSIWGEKDQPEVFFQPKDMQQIIDGWARAHS
jgi:catechol 2,3-dioxygenase-like lactoylglutathione lyase family enzyme